MLRLGLRLRVFLFFALMAGGGAAIAAGALALGWGRADPAPATGPFVTAFIVFAFLNTGLAVGVWLLFDEFVAKPINRLSADLRMRAHSGVTTGLETADARYLGDLAPAAKALTENAHASIDDIALHVAQETERLSADAARLTALLTESPIATVLLNPAGEIVLYDGQAAELLAQIAVPRLKAPMSDYFDPRCIEAAIAELAEAGGEVAFTLRDAGDVLRFDARIKALGRDGHMLFVDLARDAVASDQPRPLVFDFELMTQAQTRAVADTPLLDLCYVPFDTETTGLSVADDAIVQIGAVRVLRGAVVAGEELDTYVDPGRPIPPGSTQIHRITDAHVAGAPGIADAGQMLHHFARDAVLVAHNAPFDIGLLQKFAGEMGVTWPHPVLDTVLMSAVVFGTNADHSLDALCARLDIPIAEAERHTALGDARATAAALVALLPIAVNQGYATFGALAEETARQSRRLYSLKS
ncbi:MAG: 3'-5' exonuclease [Pseudomonadota bacterium]